MSKSMTKPIEFRNWLESSSVADAVVGVVSGGTPVNASERSHLMSRDTADFSSRVRNSIKNLGVVKSVVGRGARMRISKAIDDGISVSDLIRMISKNTVTEGRFESDMDAMEKYADVSKQTALQQPSYLSCPKKFRDHMRNRGLSNDEVEKAVAARFGPLALESSGRRTLIIMRGVSGSGKSTTARRIASDRGGVIFSTDDFFEKDGRYVFDPRMLPTNHRMNQERAEDAMRAGISPIIIDNTNTEAWEMKPYVRSAIENGYEVEIVEPGSPGFPDLDFDEIMRRQETRGDKRLPEGAVRRAMDRYQRNLSVQDILDSRSPHRP